MKATAAQKEGVGRRQMIGNSNEERRATELMR
jgi:hypothetical protein